MAIVNYVLSILTIISYDACCELILHWKRVFEITFYEHLAPQVLFIPGNEQIVPWQ